MAHISQFVEGGADVAQTDDGRGGYRYLSSIEIIQLSQAISLKRIADALAGNSNLFTAPINSYGEGIGDAIQGQLIRGQAGISQYEGR